MALELKNITRVVNGETYIDDISLSFPPGSFNVLLGRTLSGKTSLMRLMGGLDRPDSGQVIMNGDDVTGVAVQKRNISMVYQQFINYPNLSVYENIASPLRISREKDSVIDARVKEIASMLHIDPLLDRFPAELSGGQQQRTAMARALIKDSDLILFDEPLVNLDYKLREELRFELRELFAQKNTIAVYASTDPGEALALGGGTTLLDEGRVIQSGKVNDVFRFPKNIVAAELFSEPPVNIVKSSDVIRHLEDKYSLASELGFPNLSDYSIGVRPSYVSLSPKHDDDIVMDLIVDVAEISGSETFLHMRDGNLEMVAQLSGVHQFGIGSPIRVFLPLAKLFLFDANGEMVRAPQNDNDNNRSTEKVMAHG